MGMYCFGIDVGGTSVKCGLFLTNGTLVEQWEIPTRLENNGSSILPDVADAIKTKKKEIPAYVVKDGKLNPFTLKMGELTDDERDIILKGCLINYNRK